MKQFFFIVNVGFSKKQSLLDFQIIVNQGGGNVKDNLFPYKLPEITCRMIDVFVVIKIPDCCGFFFIWGKFLEILELLDPKEKHSPYEE